MLLKETITFETLERKITNGGLPEKTAYLEQRMLERRKDQDFIYRGAPHLLAASAPSDGFSPEADGLIALSYFEFWASSHGIGTLWLGLAKVFFTDVAPDILWGMGVPDTHTLGYMMAFGRPDVKFHRSYQACDQKINRVGLEAI